MNTIHEHANLFYIGTEVYISYKRKRFVVMDLDSKTPWANEYHKTIEECITFCEVNGFKICPSPKGENCEWPKQPDQNSKKVVMNLLANAVYFINQVPNHKYSVKDFHNSYDLAGEIEAALKLLKQGKY